MDALPHGLFLPIFKLSSGNLLTWAFANNDTLECLEYTHKQNLKSVMIQQSLHLIQPPRLPRRHTGNISHSIFTPNVSQWLVEQHHIFLTKHCVKHGNLATLRFLGFIKHLLQNKVLITAIICGQLYCVKWIIIRVCKIRLSSDYAMILAKSAIKKGALDICAANEKNQGCALDTRFANEKNQLKGHFNLVDQLSIICITIFHKSLGMVVACCWIWSSSSVSLDKI